MKKTKQNHFLGSRLGQILLLLGTELCSKLFIQYSVLAFVAVGAFPFKVCKETLKQNETPESVALYTSLKRVICNTGKWGQPDQGNSEGLIHNSNHHRLPQCKRLLLCQQKVLTRIQQDTVSNFTVW